ncbi:MAG: ParB/RepB/Spo0J family partition protein [Acidobacteriota bacterium]
MPKQRGLPTTARMRHDQHFVEHLTSRHIETVGRKISTQELRPNPHQPRQSFGAIEELVTSIRNVGVLEPLLVRHQDDGYEIISGERRYRAAQLAGLDEVPCIVLEVDDAKVLEIALIENLQRQDLSPYEEAEALEALIERFDYTHDELARRIGKSRTSVTETLSLGSIPVALRQRLAEADVQTKSILLEIARRENPDEQRALADLVITEGLTRDELRQLRRTEAPQAGQSADGGDKTCPAASGRPASKAPSPPRRLTYRSGRGITLTLYLSRPEIGLKEIQATLREAIDELEEPPTAGASSGPSA